MIFRPELAKQIRAGKKTQTRRPRADQAVCRYEAGKSYAVQPGRGKVAVCRITVTAVRDERLGDIDLKDVRREGFVTTQAFFDYWASLYGRLDKDQRVWVISFALGDLTDTPRFLAARPGAPHGDYVSNPHLGLKDAGEAPSLAETERFARQGYERDAKRLGEPIRMSRDRIARELEQMREHAGGSSEIRDSIRRLEKELGVLNRKLAA